MRFIELELPQLLTPLVTEPTLGKYGQLICGHAELSLDDQCQTQLSELTRQSILGTKPANKTMADCCLSGIWLLHGQLHDSHEISQNIKTPEGSFWHAVMHRLEGDYWNSQYWYRNVGPHLVIDRMQTKFGADQYPMKFVDDCERLANHGDESLQKQLAEIAVAEWKELFTYCFENAS